MSLRNLVTINDDDHVRIITLNHPNKHNPFNEELENSIKAALGEADADASVRALVVTGGQGRSFSAGGDFNEVKQLSGGSDVDRWIDRIMDLYTSVLCVSKPTIAAVDGFAIGMGFQFSLMFDWRTASSTSEFRMPELKHGIGCSVGGALLRYMVGFSSMQRIIYECNSISALQAQHYGFVNNIVDQSDLLSAAIDTGRMLAAYPEVSFKATKKAVGSELLDILSKSAAASKEVHRAAFADHCAQHHFANILGHRHEQGVACGGSNILSPTQA
jgi:carboxymethylproline synthase